MIRLTRSEWTPLPLWVCAGAVVLSVLFASRPAGAAVLYDGSLNTTPGAQGWVYLSNPLFGADATQSAAGGFTTLNTTVDPSESAGYFGQVHPSLPTPLDRSVGFRLSFDVRIAEESHFSVNRAGFSVILLASDKKGIEIGFWEDTIWAQDDSPSLFVHDEEVAYDTTAAITRYDLTIVGNLYTLAVGGSTILTGAVRDYTAFAGFPDPYETPNFVFLGDDTSSAAARIELARVELVLLPAPGGAAGVAVGLAMIAAGRRGSRRGIVRSPHDQADGD